MTHREYFVEFVYVEKDELAAGSNRWPLDGPTGQLQNEIMSTFISPHRSAGTPAYPTAIDTFPIINATLHG